MTKKQILQYLENQPETILKALDEGLKPILQNIKAEQLSSNDKKAILSKLEQLEQLALQVKKELLIP